MGQGQEGGEVKNRRAALRHLLPVVGQFKAALGQEAAKAPEGKG